MLYKPHKKSKLIRELTIEPRIKKLLEESNTSEGTRLFLESLQNYHLVHSGLTKKQFAALRDVEYADLERSSTAHDEWAEQYVKDKKIVAEICAKYYKANPPYFAHLVEKILNDDSFIPTETQYLSLCENKFAKKVLEATFSTPLFEAGDLVQGRVNGPKDVKNKIAVVVKIGEKPVVRAAKGTKSYEVLPAGEDKLIECEERHLKKVKKA
jgi:hypothetical protein